MLFRSSLVVVIDAVLVWLPWGRWGAHLPVLNPCLLRLLSGPTGGGPTLTASGEPRVPLLRQRVSGGEREEREWRRGRKESRGENVSGGESE